MIIKKLQIRNFRNYSNANIIFSPGYNVITGDNGVGKTNILESISVISNIRSFRNSYFDDIIKHGENSFYCVIEMEECENKIYEVGYLKSGSKISKKLQIDGVEIKKFYDYYGKLLCVIISPDDIEIINGNPDYRRKYFDGIFSKIDKEYFEKLTLFKKILNNRNSIIRGLKENTNKLNNNNQLEVWDTMFSETASFIIKKRREYCIKINEEFGKIYTTLSENEFLPRINYNSNISINDIDDIYSQLRKNYNRDIALGSTAIGPQRDDYIIENDKGRIFKNYSSQGQKRSAVISLKAAELSFIENNVKKKQ